MYRETRVYRHFIVVTRRAVNMQMKRHDDPPRFTRRATAIFDFIFAAFSAPLPPSLFDPFGDRLYSFLSSLAIFSRIFHFILYVHAYAHARA